MRTPALERGEVHLWHLELGDAPSPDPHDGLDASEAARALRFHFERDRARYVRAHRALRRIVAGYLGTEPLAVRIGVEPGGKPFLEDGDGLAFNLTHSGARGLLAVTRGGPIGVDLEMLGVRLDVANLARSVFTASEIVDLLNGAPAGRERAFLTGWTRKEAYLKALGVGLAAEPSKVHVGLDEARGAIGTEGTGRSAIDVATVLRDRECIASLALAGGWENLRHWRLQEAPAHGSAM
jgi:4'-phosphopantetheinyl transferase